MGLSERVLHVGTFITFSNPIIAILSNYHTNRTFGGLSLWFSFGPSVHPIVSHELGAKLHYIKTWAQWIVGDHPVGITSNKNGTSTCHLVSVVGPSNSNSAWLQGLRAHTLGPKGLWPNSFHFIIGPMSGSSSCFLCNTAGLSDRPHPTWAFDSFDPLPAFEWEGAFVSFVGAVPSCTWALLVHPLPDFFWEGTHWSPSRATIICFFALFDGPLLGFDLGVSLGHFCPAIAVAMIPCPLFWDHVKYPCVKAGWLICGLTTPLISGTTNSIKYNWNIAF